MKRALLLVEGVVELGPGLRLGAGPAAVHLTAGPGSSIRLGPGCRLDPGVTILAGGPVRLGARVRCALHVLIGDLADPGGAPIEIGDDVELGPRAVVLPGTRLGAGSSVFAGSVASGEVPPGSLVVGNPGRLERRGAPPLNVADGPG